MTTSKLLYNVTLTILWQKCEKLNFDTITAKYSSFSAGLPYTHTTHVRRAANSQGRQIFKSELKKKITKLELKRTYSKNCRLLELNFIMRRR